MAYELDLDRLIEECSNTGSAVQHNKYGLSYCPFQEYGEKSRCDFQAHSGPVVFGEIRRYVCTWVNQNV